MLFLSCQAPVTIKSGTNTVPGTYWTLNKHSMKGRMKPYRLMSLSQGVPQPIDTK